MTQVARPERARRPWQETLRATVLRAHLSMALLAVALAGVLLVLAGLVALRFYVDSNLQLVARSLAYTVEAAVVFDDRAEAESTLRRMVQDEGVAEARVTDAQGAVFAEWRSERHDPAGQLARAVAALVMLEPISEPILYDGEPAGSVTLRSDGLGLLRFVASGLILLLLCISVSGAVGTSVTGRGEERISRRSRVTASTSAGVRRGAGRPRSPMPSWPWT